MELAGQQHVDKRGVNLLVTPKISRARNTIRWLQAGLRLSALIVGLVHGGLALAVGLGNLHVRSALSHPLRAQLDLISPTDADLDGRCYQAKVSSLDGTQLAKVLVELKTDGATPALVLSTVQSIDEPAFSLNVEYSCGSPSRREYQVLLDLAPVAPTVAETPHSATVPAPEKRAMEAPTQFFLGTTIASVEPEHVAKKTKHHHNPTEIVPSSEYAQTPPLSSGANSEVRHKKTASKKYRNVLRLSDDDNVDTSLDDTQGMSLTMSRGLFGSSAPAASQSSSTAAPEAQTAAVAPAAVAANGQTPVAAPVAAETAVPPNDAALQALQAKIRILEVETEELRRLNAAHMAALEAAQKAKAGNGQLISLYVLLFASFIAIVWLVWRTRQIQSEISDSHWHQIVPEQEEREEQPQTRRYPSEEEVDDGFLDAPLEASNVMPLKPITKPAAVDKPDHSTGLAAQDAQSPVRAAEGEYKYPPKSSTALPDAEEILDEIQQAEFWMEMQQPERAIEILESNWGGDRPSSPLPWLYLLDLYRQVRDQEKYEELTERFEHIFNGKVASWDDGNAFEHSRTLDEFPFVISKIVQLWPTTELVPYMENLLIDDRDGRRQGFDLAAYRDILFLTNIAYEIQEDGESKAPQTAPEWSLLN